MALGFMTRALLKMMGEEQELRTLEQLKNTLKSSELESLGKTIAKKLQEKVPVIYASRTNEALAYNWKIKCNETGKIPAYWNVFPELNHNEMTGFDETPETKGLSEQFHFLFLEDPDDDPRIQKRMKITKDLCQKRNLAVESVPLGEGGFWEKTFRSLILADWIAYHLSAFYGTEAEQVPMVEEFKRLIA
jgi:glucose/mannose-6-phosphate isomerase